MASMTRTTNKNTYVFMEDFNCIENNIDRSPHIKTTKKVVASLER